MNTGNRTRARLRIFVEGAASVYILLVLAGYAFAKIVQSQFANRGDPYKAEIRVGDLSSVELLWALYSRAPMYETMLGVIEAMCLVLVFFRRTRPIGALLTLAVMSNVAAMNLAFGIGATFNAVTLAIAAAVLCVLYLPTYRQWLATNSGDVSASGLSKGWMRLGLAVKTLALVISLGGAFGIWIKLLRPLAAMKGDLYGRWEVQSVQGAAPSANGVEPLRPGQIVMFNKMNVLAIRSGDDFRFGRYVEDDPNSILELAVYAISQNDLRKLPPPGRLEERATALKKYPLGYQVRGTFERQGTDNAIARFSLQPQGSTVVVALHRR